MANPTPSAIRQPNIRSFLESQQLGLLSTISAKVLGYPFGSITPFDLDSQGRLVIFVSELSEHSKNLSAKPRGSMLLAESIDPDRALAKPRATLIGDFHAVPETELEKIAESYWNRFPNSPSKQIAQNCFFWRMMPKNIRWISGFGKMGWLDAAEYKSIFN